MRKYLTTILLASTFFISEVHTYWEKKPVVYENWIIRNYKPMPVQWNVKYASMQAIYIIWFLAWILYVPNRINRVMVVTVFIWAILDTILYFYNFKNYEYGPVYLWVGAIFILTLYWNKWTGWIWKTLHPK